MNMVNSVNNVITLASAKDGYDRSVGAFLDTAAGSKVGYALNAVGAILFLLLIVAFVLKKRNSQQQWVQQFTGNGIIVVATVVVATLLVAFKILLPLFASLGDDFIGGMTKVIQNFV